jgi:hypothetical protein
VPGLNGDTVSVISYAKRREVKRIRVGRHPQDLDVGRVPVSVLQDSRGISTHGGR